MSEVRCFVGEGIQLKDDLTFSGAFRLEGQLEGGTVCGDVLILGAQAQVHGEIDVEAVQIGGEVQGSVSARQRLELLSSGWVTGTMKTPRLVIWKGARFDGTCLSQSRLA